MTIKIAHLYYDLMNLYGENGNVKALKKHFEDQGINVEIHFLTIGDNIDFSLYDIFYIGSGTEEYELLVINDLMMKKNELKAAIEGNKYFFVTGNAIEIFGSYIEDFDKKRIDALNIFDYYTKVIDIENYTIDVKFRITGEVIAKCNLIDKKIIGFQNRCGTLHNVSSPFLEIEKGCGNYPKDKNEGFIYKNFVGTYTIGPLFIRNPYLTDYFVTKIINEKFNNHKILINTSTPEYIAYNKFLENEKEE